VRKQQLALEGVTSSVAATHRNEYRLLRVPPPTGPGIQVVARWRPANVGGVRSMICTAWVDARQLSRSFRLTDPPAVVGQTRSR
jgi:hypothetical protein